MSDDPQMSTTPPLPVDEIRPPTSEVGALGWLHHNLFSSKLNGLVTIVLGVVVLLIVMAVYLLVSLLTSVLMNFYNRMVQIHER